MDNQTQFASIEELTQTLINAEADIKAMQFAHQILYKEVQAHNKRLVKIEQLCQQNKTLINS